MDGVHSQAITDLQRHEAALGPNGTRPKTLTSANKAGQGEMWGSYQDPILYRKFHSEFTEI